MIKSPKELAITKRKAEEAHEGATYATGSARAELERLAARLEAEVQEYKLIVEGRRPWFEIDDIDGLADALTAARLARRLTQKDLADRLGVSEQQVQKDEAGAYERASLARIADIADVLEYRLVGRLEPCPPAPLLPPGAVDWGNAEVVVVPLGVNPAAPGFANPGFQRVTIRPMA